jgi:hypothetical protein
VGFDNSFHDISQAMLTVNFNFTIAQARKKECPAKFRVLSGVERTGPPGCGRRSTEGSARETNDGSA